MDNYNNISGISPEKLNLLSEIIRQSENVSSENLIPFFLNAAATANAKGINFSDAETDVIINALKTNMTKEQISKLDTVRKLAKIISSNRADWFPAQFDSYVLRKFVEIVLVSKNAPQGLHCGGAENVSIVIRRRRRMSLATFFILN